MAYSLVSYYLFIKLVFLYSLVRIQTRFEPMKDHWLFLGGLYTSGIAFLSYVFIVGWQKVAWAPWQNQVAQLIGVSPWLAWLGETLLLSTLYFRLLARFEEGILFWLLLLMGLALVWF